MRRVRRHPVLHTSHQPEALCTENVIELIFSRYWYDDPANKTNGEFDVVTHNPHGYVFYEAKFRSTPVTQEMIDEEIEQVRSTGLSCYAYGFFSRSGFDGNIETSGQLRLFDIAELYR